ncbi:hypothetical protein [Rhizobium sp. Leaf453]|uniref:hypothetical protein n=1 Tax=Rhizobium sp. Leaf453 TaxID=1736380 RepID=UPI0012E33898|nr:hypothetical protein [Rhizobium sp. Leaf453]
MNTEINTTAAAPAPADIDAFPALREVVFHLEAAASLLRENAPSGFQILMREIIHEGTRFEEISTVHVLEVDEQTAAFGPILGRRTTHTWRGIWSGPVA